MLNDIINTKINMKLKIQTTLLTVCHKKYPTRNYQVIFDNDFIDEYKSNKR